MIEEPFSTASNLMYIFVGLVIYSKNKFISLLLMMLGITSAWFHISGVYISQRLDVAFIFAVLLGIIASKFRSLGAPNWIYSPSFVGALVFFLLHGQYSSFVFIGILFFISLLFHYLENENVDEVLNIIIIFAVAFTFRQLGAYLEGYINDLVHGFGWHILTAYGFYLFYR